MCCCFSRRLRQNGHDRTCTGRTRRYRGRSCSPPRNTCTHTQRRTHAPARPCILTHAYPAARTAPCHVHLRARARHLLRIESVSRPNAEGIRRFCIRCRRAQTQAGHQVHPLLLNPKHPHTPGPGIPLPASPRNVCMQAGCGAPRAGSLGCRLCPCVPSQTQRHYRRPGTSQRAATSWRRGMRHTSRRIRRASATTTASEARTRSLHARAA